MLSSRGGKNKIKFILKVVCWGTKNSGGWGER